MLFRSPVSQLFELVVERLPNFPYGRGYYDEMYNIWYNKYDCNELKTEKKIKQLKMQMASGASQLLWVQTSTQKEMKNLLLFTPTERPYISARTDDKAWAALIFFSLKWMKTETGVRQKISDIR